MWYSLLHTKNQVQSSASFWDMATLLQKNVKMASFWPLSKPVALYLLWIERRKFVKQNADKHHKATESHQCFRLSRCLLFLPKTYKGTNYPLTSCKYNFVGLQQSYLLFFSHWDVCPKGTLVWLFFTGCVSQRNHCVVSGCVSQRNHCVAFLHWVCKSIKIISMSRRTACMHAN
jgi:hypothetical protein